jgi:putative peptidoglycan lipid II flippase
VIGALVYFLVQLPSASRTGFRWRPRLAWREPGLQKIATLMLPRMLGQGATQFSNIITTRIASFLPAGSVSALYYGFLLMMLPLGTFAMSAGNAAFPTLAEQATRGEDAKFASTVRRTLSGILFLMIPSALGLIVVGLPLIETLYQRGRFTLESSEITWLALAMYAIGLPAHGSIEILSRSFYARHNTRTPVTVAVAAMAANVGLAIALAGPLAHVGIALALSVTTTAEALTLAYLLHRTVPGLLDGEFMSSLGRMVIAGCALVAGSWIALAAMRHAGLPPLLQTAGGVGAGAAAYLGAAYLLGSPDLDAMLQAVRARISR